MKLTYNSGEVMIMSEYCLDCWNEINETNDPKEKYILSKELDLCEGCGEWKPVIIRANSLYCLVEWVREMISRKS